jgi:hypothetical protein
MNTPILLSHYIKCLEYRLREHDHTWTPMLTHRGAKSGNITLVGSSPIICPTPSLGYMNSINYGCHDPNLISYNTQGSTHKQSMLKLYFVNDREVFDSSLPHRGVATCPSKIKYLMGWKTSEGREHL